VNISPRTRRLMGCARPLMILFGVMTAGQARGDPGQVSGVAAPSMASGRVQFGVDAMTPAASRLSLSLADAVALGLRNNRDIRRSYLQRVAQKFDLKVAEAFFSPRALLGTQVTQRQGSQDRERQMSVAPKITLNSEWGTRFSLSWTQRLERAEQGGLKSQRGLGLEVVQPLLRDAGRDVVTAPRRRARLSEQSHRLGLQATVAQSVTRIASAYRELLKAQEQLRIVSQALERSRKQMRVNDALIAAGRMAQVDRLQNEADLAYQELNAEQAAHQLEASRRVLLQLLALDLSTPVHASDELQAERVDLDGQQALAIARQRQPHYLQQRIAQELADIDLLEAKNQQWWDVSLVAGANQDRHAYSSSSTSGVDRRWNSYAGVQLEIPIGDLTQRQRLIAAQVAVDSQALQQAEAQQALERDVSDAVRTVQSHWRQYQIASRSLDLSHRKLAAEQQKLQAGRTSNFQVLSFEEDLRRTENAVLNAQIAYLNAQTQLDERLGMTLDSWEIALND
jgi:outer membrane protein TolC